MLKNDCPLTLCILFYKCIILFFFAEKSCARSFSFESDRPFLTIKHSTHKVLIHSWKIVGKKAEITFVNLHIACGSSQRYWTSDINFIVGLNLTRQAIAVQNDAQ